MQRAEVKRRQLLAARKDVLALLKRYRDFVSPQTRRVPASLAFAEPRSCQSATVSDLFLDLHHRLEALEDDVQRAERGKAKEAKERY